MSEVHSPNKDSTPAEDKTLQCEYCSHDLEDDDATLIQCDFCTTVAYCSFECQESHEAEHRLSCPWIEDVFGHSGECVDEEAQMLWMTAGISVAVVTKDVVLDELDGFAHEFSEEIFQAAFNCLNIRKTPNAWRNNVVYIVLQRVAKFPFTSGEWQRYQVKAFDSLRMELAAKRLPPDMKPQFLQDKRTQEKKLLAQGKKGCLTIVLCARCPPLEDLMFYTLTRPFSQSTFSVDRNWYRSFVDVVEQESGREIPRISV